MQHAVANTPTTMRLFSISVSSSDDIQDARAGSTRGDNCRYGGLVRGRRPSHARRHIVVPGEQYDRVGDARMRPLDVCCPSRNDPAREPQPEGGLMSAPAVAGLTRDQDPSRIPYQLPQPTGMLPDVYLKDALDLAADEHLWVPQAESVSFKPLVLAVSQGYYVNLLRVRKAGVLSRHRHTGPVHAFTLRGTWRYLEHDWVAQAGDYAFEPPGETHTLVIPDGVEEMVMLFHVTGGYTYVDPYGKALGYEDVFTKLDNARRHYEAIGLGPDYVNRFVR